jgi:ADP-ribose pyrophosphatase
MSEKPPDFTETTLGSRTVYRGRLLHVLEDEVRLPDGSRSRREYIRHPGAAAVLPWLDSATIVLVRQFRYPARRHFLELPAGKLDEGEAPLASAQRELREECGYAAAQWDPLGEVHPCIGYSDERIVLYAARGLTEVGRAPAHGEFVEPVPTPFERALAWVRDGTITDAKTVIGLLRAAELERR